MHKIIIEVPPSRNDEPKVRVEGVKGTSCVTLTKPLEDELSGGTANGRKHTAEYNQIAQPGQKNLHGQSNG